MNDIDLYENQYILNNKLHAKYICVHDDTFGRGKTKDELFEIIKKSLEKRSDVDFYFKTLSLTKNGLVNMFLLTLISDIDKPIHLYICEENGYNSLDNDLVDQLENLYYHVTECDYRGK